MDSEDLEIAVRATQELDRLYGQDGLLKAVRGGGVSARTWAAASLQGHPSAESKEALLKCLADPEAPVRSKAVIALRAMCDQTCVPQIQPLTEDSNEIVREMARATLTMLTTSSVSEHRPDVVLATGVVLTNVVLNKSADALDKSQQRTVIYYHYKTPSTRCVEILAEVRELWERTLRPEAEATGVMQVTMWPESTTDADRDYTQRRVEGGWKPNYDAECPPGAR